MARTLSSFVSAVHLGLDLKDPKDRARRFVGFLRSIPADHTENLFLMGDIWDFWYEYRDVVPKGYARVFATIQDLVEAGVKVWFFRGNHDVWSFSYFEEMGMRRLEEPFFVNIGGKEFCLGHGDAIGCPDRGYRFLRRVFHNRFLQMLFSTLHPWIAFRLGNTWSRHNRLAREKSDFVFDFGKCALPAFAEKALQSRRVDYFIFGHYHADAEKALTGGSRLVLLKDWFDDSPYLLFDTEATPDLISGRFGYSQNRE